MMSMHAVISMINALVQEDRVAIVTEHSNAAYTRRLIGKRIKEEKQQRCTNICKYKRFLLVGLSGIIEDTNMIGESLSC